MPVVRLYAGLRTAAGVKQTRVEGNRLRDVLLALVAEHPALDGAVLDGDGLCPHVVVTINGNHVSPESGIDISIAPDDQVAIFPPIAGG